MWESQPWLGRHKQGSCAAPGPWQTLFPLRLPSVLCSGTREAACRRWERAGKSQGQWGAQDPSDRVWAPGSTCHAPGVSWESPGPTYTTRVVGPWSLAVPPCLTCGTPTPRPTQAPWRHLALLGRGASLSQDHPLNKPLSLHGPVNRLSPAPSKPSWSLPVRPAPPEGLAKEHLRSLHP